MGVASTSEVDRAQRRWSGRGRWLLGVGILITLLAALGVWNPRHYIVLDEVFNHPFVAGMLLLALIGCSLLGELPEHRWFVRTALPALVVAGLTVVMLMMGNAIDDERVESVVDVQGTDLSISIRSYHWWDGGWKPSFLYLHSGDGLLERRIRVGETKQDSYDPIVRARLLESGAIRVEWEHGADRPLDYWTLTLDPEDDLRVTGIESSYGCHEEFEVPCVAAP